MYAMQNAWWRWLRVYNWVVLMIELAYCIPYITDDREPEDYAPIIGLSKQPPAQLAVPSDIAIFCLLTLQAWVFTPLSYGEA